MLHIMKSDGGALRSVNNNARGGPWHEEVHPAWSPDGKTIVYAADGRGANNVLYAVDADGADRCQLTDHQGGDGAPAWSPDGETIAFHRGIGFVPQVHLMDPTGARRRQLTFRPGANGAPNVVAGW